MSSQRLVSIVMPAFNAARTIEGSIHSVLAQTYINWELIVIDDASTDSTVELCRQMEIVEPRIRLIQCTKNGGVARARNIGLEASRGTLIAFLDSDDIWLPNKLMVQLHSVMNESVMSYMAYEHIDQAGSRGKLIVPPKNVSRREALGGNPIGTLTVMLSKDIIGPHRFPLRGHEDYALWLAILRDIPFAVRSGEACAYAQYRRGYSSLSGSKLKALRWQWSIYRQQERLSRTKSASYLLQYGVNGILKHYF